jgi:hypothetical protein
LENKLVYLEKKLVYWEMKLVYLEKKLVYLKKKLVYFKKLTYLSKNFTKRKKKHREISTKVTLLYKSAFCSGRKKERSDLHFDELLVCPKKSH